METLLKQFPEYVYRGYDGTATAFIVEDREDNPKVQQVLNYVQSLGYEFESRPKDFSRKVNLQRTIVYEESDCDRADFVRAIATKYSRAGAIGFIRSGRAKINNLPPKFKLCLSQSVTLITPSVKKRLEDENFKGFLFLPVYLVKGARASMPEDYEGHLPEELVPNLFALTGSTILSRNSDETIEQWQVRKAESTEFDLVLGDHVGDEAYDVRSIFFGQRLYQYWKKNLGDMTWHPIFLSDL